MEVTLQLTVNITNSLQLASMNIALYQPPTEIACTTAHIDNGKKNQNGTQNEIWKKEFDTITAPLSADRTWPILVGF